MASAGDGAGWGDVDLNSSPNQTAGLGFLDGNSSAGYSGNDTDISVDPVWWAMTACLYVKLLGSALPNITACQPGDRRQFETCVSPLIYNLFLLLPSNMAASLSSNYDLTSRTPS